MNKVVNNLQTWECSKCTLINNIMQNECGACQALNPAIIQRVRANSEPPAANTADRLLSKFPLISNTVAKIDSAIDALSEQFNAITDRRTAETVDNWLCPKCNQLNINSKRYCTTCRFDKEVENKFFTWKCNRCNLRQPQPPFESKCPVCHKKITSPMTNENKSMSHLNSQDFLPSEELPTRPAEEDSRECAQIYTTVVQFCAANGHSFIDDAFPHSNRSIGDLRLLDQPNLNIIWLRPQDIRTKDGRRFRWSIFNDPKSSDIEQGLLGNCWVMSALALIAERSDLLERIFVTKDYNMHGVYQIRLCIDGLWKTVVVDDFFPCHYNKRMMVFGVGRNNQLWVSLIEKALAKNYGGYSRLRAGRMHEGLTTLTGFPCLNIDIDSHLDEEGFVDVVWAQVCSALESNYLVGASCGAGRRSVDDREYRGLGLNSQHAYSILKVCKMDNNRLIRLRNPWGTFVWTGVYGPSWLQMLPEMRQKLEPNEGASGTFWMPFESFVKYFDAIDVCCVNTKWKVVRYPLNIGWNPKKCGCLRLLVDESTDISISLFQQSMRSTQRDNVDLMILVHKEDRSNVGFPSDLVMVSERRVYDSLTVDGFLEPGVYVLYALSLSKATEQFVQPGSLVVHSTKYIRTEMLSASLHALRSSLQELVLKHGRTEETLKSSDCLARILTTNFSGLIVMVDNFSTSHVLQTKTDCQQSTNVISTRGQLLTFDSIPPLHRQILTILSHFENTQPFSISQRMQVKLTNFADLGNPFPAGTQHVPGYASESAFALHGPIPLYS